MQLLKITPPPHEIVRYGKSMFDILNTKFDFFDENDVHLLKNERIACIYKQQPVRTHCKICGSKLPSVKYFTSHTVDYFLCNLCGHLNGLYQDTNDFAEKIYSNDEYGKNYSEPTLKQYIQRLDSIYIPKANFLVDSLRSLDIDYDTFEYLDVGSGSGYMVGALHRLGLSATGIEVSMQQVEYGNRMLGNKFLSTCHQEEVLEKVSKTSSQVLCFIGVFEHISDLSIMLESIKNNKKIQYVFFSVPMFSLSCIFESIFPEVFNRQLGGGHTHLFTEKSLDWIYNRYGFIKQAEWYFGTDIMDLYRSIVVMLKKQNANIDLIESISTLIKENADSIQLLLDRSKFTSEKHILIKINT